MSKLGKREPNKIFRLEELYDEINDVLENDIVLSGVRVKAEVSSYKMYPSGHIYITLVEKASQKDKDGKDVFLRLTCKWFKGFNQFSKDKTKIKVGDVITVFGTVNCYNANSQVSIIVKSVFLTDEEGQAKAEREKRRLELEQKGYFDPAHKKPQAPKYPRAIGIITSEAGDARYDIEKTVQKKNPYVQLYLCHSSVQGAGAGASIANAIRFFDKKEDVDIIIIGRGGGDKLDLTAFDDVEVVEAIYHCNTYIIAGTGHTPNRTLADYAVDKLSNNPTDAAYDAVFDVVSELEKIDNQIERMNSSIYTKYDYYAHWLEKTRLEIENKSPVLKLNNRFAELEGYSRDMSHNILRVLNLYENALGSMTAGVQMNSPKVRLEGMESDLTHLTENINMNIRERFTEKWNACVSEIKMLDAQNPAKKLIGGFGYIEKAGEPITSVNDVQVNDEINIKVHDGELMAQVVTIQSNPAKVE